MAVAGLPAYLAVFDTETDSVDTEDARVVTAFIGKMDTATGEIVEEWSWVLDTEREMPEIPASIHGYSTERMQEEGGEYKQGIFEIIQRLDILNREGLAFVVMNARYDFTLLDRQTRRSWPGIRPFEPRYVVDPYVIDKKLDKWRKGKRNLVSMAATYGVPVLENAHDARADCIMAGQVAIKQLQHPWLLPLTLEDLHRRSIKNAADQADGLRDYFTSQATKLATSDPEKAAGFAASAASVQNAWPIVPFTESEI